MSVWGSTREPGGVPVSGGASEAATMPCRASAAVSVPLASTQNRGEPPPAAGDESDSSSTSSGSSDSSASSSGSSASSSGSDDGGGRDTPPHSPFVQESPGSHS